MRVSARVRALPRMLSGRSLKAFLSRLASRYPERFTKGFYAAFGLFCALFAAGEESKACLSHAK